jgi:putative aminopeptidase FrvX
VRELLKKLTDASGISGFEDGIRNVIISEIKDHVDEIEVDNMGNMIATRKGKEGGKKVMLAAHMDEIGLMVRYIDKNGFIKFSKIGGINDQMLLNQEVTVKTSKGDVIGVIGSKPPHRMKSSEMKKVISYEDMFIDIGAADKEEAEKMVAIGDPILINQDFAELGKSLVKAKALDNRVGCAVLVEVMKQLESNATVYGVATVQEEVGLKGAKTSAFKVNPDLAIVLDVTISGDHPGIKEEEAPAKAGKGPVIVLADASGRGIITNLKVKELLISTADEEKIPYQLEVSEGGTTDASVIHLTREGIPTGVISPAARYIHTPVSVVNVEDVENAVKLIVAVLKRI